MAFIPAPMSAKSILGFPGLSTIAAAGIPSITLLKPIFKLPPPTPSNFRSKDAIRLRVKQRLPVVFASNTDPAGGDSLEEKSDKIKTSDSVQGPPILTILAGFLVFLTVLWILGSIILWLVSLIVHVPPSK